MAASTTKSLVRTVQYWRLVDGRDSKPVTDVDWYTFTAGWTGDLEEEVDGAKLTGTLQTIDIEDGTRLRGIVLSSEKDYLPNEREAGTGNQKAMDLSGDTWSPVDNLFVVFLPFGNLIAVLAESVSASRAGKFAAWLDLRADPTQEEDFYWAAAPVIDEERAELLNGVSGLRKLTLRAPFGTKAAKDPSFLQTLQGVPNQVKGWEIEISIKAKTKDSDHHDEEALLEYFEGTLGGLTGAESKAVLVTSGSDDRGPTEIDLLHHRVTRKAKVEIAHDGTRHAAISVRPVMHALVKAFHQDRADLQRIVGDGADNVAGGGN